MPDVRVPYHGVDAWVAHRRSSSAATVAHRARRAARVRARAVAARSATRSSPRSRSRRSTSFAVMQHDSAHQFLARRDLRAAARRLPLARARRAPRGARWRHAVVVVAVVAGLVVAPGLDRQQRRCSTTSSLAQALSSASSQRYDWNHDYGPLNWPRDGREVLRVQAPASRLLEGRRTSTLFDGLRWLQGNETTAAGLDGGAAAAHIREWLQDAERRRSASLRLARSSSRPGIDARRSTRAPRQPVLTGPGDVHDARPAADAGQRLPRRSSTRRVPTRRAAARRVPCCRCRPQTDGTGLTDDRPAAPHAAASAAADPRAHPGMGRGRPGVRTPSRPSKPRRTRACTSSRASCALARRRRIDVHARGREPPRATATPTPRTHAAAPSPLVNFLFDERAGYCQQFSGAMALLLRIGGVPGARRGRLRARALRRPSAHEYVVRDIDAHSWVEVFFPGIGWVTARPDARRRARALADLATPRPRRRRRRRRCAIRRPSCPRVASSPTRSTASAPRAAASDDSGPPLVPHRDRRGARSRWAPRSSSARRRRRPPRRATVRRRALAELRARAASQRPAARARTRRSTRSRRRWRGTRRRGATCAR